METKQYTTKTLEAAATEIREQLTAILKEIGTCTDETRLQQLWRQASIYRNKLEVCNNRLDGRINKQHTAAIMPNPLKLNVR